MALHRDIFWIGRQWAVTGSGIQAIDQRLRGVLDIEIARLWDEDFVQGRRAKPGLNVEDFDKALTIARTRFPKEPVTPAVAVQALAPRVVEPPPAPPSPAPPPPVLALRAQGRLARFLPQWRIRIRR
jgi:hypothetical protein